MAKPTIYLDTSVINFLYADDAPEKKEITVAFFEDFVKKSIYDTFVAEFVIKEIGQTSDEAQRDRLLDVLGNYPIEVLILDDIQEIEFLASHYLNSGILPAKSTYDALHVACSVVRKLDYLVSWNYKHLANINKERKFTAKNYELGYFHPLRIVSPIQLIAYGT